MGQQGVVSRAHLVVRHFSSVMDPRRRVTQASAAAAAAGPSLLSLPDALLVECLRHVPQDQRCVSIGPPVGLAPILSNSICRHPAARRAARPPSPPLLVCIEHTCAVLFFSCRLQDVALVNKRLSGLCLAPQLLQTLQVAITSGDGPAVVQRTQSLLELLTAHGGHVRHLDLDVQLPEVATDEEHNEVAALVTACLAACAAAGGGPETLLFSADTPLASTAPLAGLTRLQKLEGLGK